MIIDLIGVLKDGTRPRGAGVPPDPRQTLGIIHGESVLLRLQVFGENGVAIDTTGRTFVWTIQKKVSQEGTVVPVIKREGINLAGGRVDFVLEPDDTIQKPIGNYIYDIWTQVTATGEQEPVVPLSGLILATGLFPLPFGTITPSPGTPIIPDSGETRGNRCNLSDFQEGPRPVGIGAQGYLEALPLVVTESVPDVRCEVVTTNLDNIYIGTPFTPP